MIFSGSCFYERHPESMRTVPWLRPAGRVAVSGACGACGASVADSRIDSFSMGEFAVAPHFSLQIDTFSMWEWIAKLRDEKRPISRNDLPISRSRIYCKLQYIVEWGARMYCKLQYILDLEISNSFLLLSLFSQRFSGKQYPIGKPSNFDRLEINIF